MSSPDYTPCAEEPSKIVINERDSQLIRHYLPGGVRELVKVVVEAVCDEYQREPEVWIYGKIVNQPHDLQYRSTNSRGYFHSGQVAMAQPLSEEMERLIEWANRFTGSTFNAILINRYMDGTKTISAHSEREAGIDENGGVLAISYGTERNFCIREKSTKQVFKNVPARHGEAIQMKGSFQKYFTHEIPREARVIGELVSLTFLSHDIAAERKLWDQHMKKVEEKKRMDNEQQERKKMLVEELKQIKANRAAKDEADKANNERLKRKRESTQENMDIIKKIANRAKKDAEELAAMTPTTAEELAKMKRQSMIVRRLEA